MKPEVRHRTADPVVCSLLAAGLSYLFLRELLAVEDGQFEREYSRLYTAIVLTIGLLLLLAVGALLLIGLRALFRRA